MDVIDPLALKESDWVWRYLDKSSHWIKKAS